MNLEITNLWTKKNRIHVSSAIQKCSSPSEKSKLVYIFSLLILRFLRGGWIGCWTIPTAELCGAWSFVNFFKWMVSIHCLPPRYQKPLHPWSRKVWFYLSWFFGWSFLLCFFFWEVLIVGCFVGDRHLPEMIKVFWLLFSFQCWELQVVW